MKRVLAVLVSMLLLVMMIPMGAVSVSAASRTREEAVQWALSKVGASLDYDGQYSAQCVDLIYYYYSYLGVTVMGGNASAYVSNALPSGWQRITVVPGVTQMLPGDIAVWKPGYSYGDYSTSANGHVGIIIDSDSVGFMAVEQRAYGSTLYTWFPLQTLNCVIRPNFVEPHVHSWSAWSVTKVATCAVEGQQKRTCACGGVETQPIPATGKHTYDNVCDSTCNVCGDPREAGHNFSVVVTEATCSEYGKRCYTCVDCGYSYEEIVADYVSDWSTEYPTGVDEECIESKTEYRYRDREWKETTSKLTGDWILEGSYTRLGDFGPWSGWVNSPIAANDNTQVQTQKAYTYYYYLCPACGAHMHVYNQCYPWAGGCGSYAINSGNYVEVYSTTSYSGVQDFHGTGKHYAYVDGQLVFRHSNGEVTQYRSRTRQIETVYSYYRYTDWTDWGDEYNASNDTLEERTVYRYVIADLADHTYDNICDTDCNICGHTRIPTEHFYDDEYDATCNVCGEEREVPEKPIVPDLPADAPAFVVESTDAREGEEFTVAIRTQRNSGIVSMKLSVAYDTDVLELIALEEQDFANVVFSPLTKNPFMVNWADAISPNNTTNGVVVLATFRVKEGAPLGKTEITLTYDPEDVYDENYDNVAFRVENGSVEIVDYIPGDVNADGRVNNKDLGLLQQYLSGWDVRVDEKAGDVNNDGRVNNKDLGLFQQYLSGWDVELG